jgi:hypothetical protein
MFMAQMNKWVSSMCLRHLFHVLDVAVVLNLPIATASKLLLCVALLENITQRLNNFLRYDLANVARAIRFIVAASCTVDACHAITVFRIRFPPARLRIWSKRDVFSLAHFLERSFH